MVLARALSNCSTVESRAHTLSADSLVRRQTKDAEKPMRFIFGMSFPLIDSAMESLVLGQLVLLTWGVAQERMRRGQSHWLDSLSVVEPALPCF